MKEGKRLKDMREHALADTYRGTFCDANFNPKGVMQYRFCDIQQNLIMPGTTAVQHEIYPVKDHTGSTRMITRSY